MLKSGWEGPPEEPGGEVVKGYAQEGHHQLDRVLPATPTPPSLCPDLKEDIAGQEEEGWRADKQLADAQLKQDPAEACEVLILCESCWHRWHEREEGLGWIEVLKSRSFRTSLGRCKTLYWNVRLRGHYGYNCHVVRCH